MLTWALAIGFALAWATVLIRAAAHVRLRRRLQAMEAALGELASARLPAIVDASHDPLTPAPGPWQPKGLKGTEYAGQLGAIEAGFARALQRAQGESEASARSTVRAFAGAVRSLGKELETVVDEAQMRHDDPEVFGDLTRIDHSLQQLILKTQSAAIIGGDLPGQRWPATVLTDVVRGAASRVRDYRRIRTPRQGEVLVDGRYVEPVVHAVAVLLDNAARHSDPSTTVDVTLQEGHNGWSIMVDDAGVKISREELARADRLLSGVESADIHRLGDPPRLGFAVLATLSHRYRFYAFVDGESRYGGTRAGLFIPNELLEFGPPGPVGFPLPNTDVPNDATRSASPSPEAPAGVPVGVTAGVAASAPAGAASAGSTGPAGLPKRRRKQRSGVPSSPGPAATATTNGGHGSGSGNARGNGSGIGNGSSGVGGGNGGTVSALTPSAVGAWQRGSRSDRIAVDQPPDRPDRPDRLHREGSDRT